MGWWGEIQPVKKPLYPRSNLLNLNLWGTATVKFTGVDPYLFQRCLKKFTGATAATPGLQVWVVIYSKDISIFFTGATPGCYLFQRYLKKNSQGPPLVQNKGFLFHRGYRKRSVFTAQNLQSIKNIFDYQTKWISQEWLHFFPNPTLLSWAAFLQ